jgi:hypothetical protein
MPLDGRWLALTLIFLALWLAFLCWLFFGLVRQAKLSHSIDVRGRFTFAGIGLSIVAVGSLLFLYVSWTSVWISQRFDVGAIRVLAQFLFWPTLAGLFFSATGSGKKRFWALGSCLITGLWWLSLATTAAISMGGAPIARHPANFFIPANFVGWVEVNYGARNTPTLQIKDGVLIFSIPSDGILATSSTLEEGWAKDQYFYYSQDGSINELRETGWERGGMIWANTVEAPQPVYGSSPVNFTESSMLVRKKTIGTGCRTAKPDLSKNPAARLLRTPDRRSNRN